MMIYVNGLIGIIICILVFLVIYLLRKLFILDDKLDETRRVCRFYKVNFSMLEYYYREYKEGNNVFSSMRDISELINNEKLYISRHEEEWDDDFYEIMLNRDKEIKSKE